MALVKYNNNSISSVTALGSLSSGSLNLITTNTITSGVSSSSFTSNIDSTYDTYIFKFINIHSANDDAKLLVNFSSDTGSNYNVTKTTTFFNAQHKEDDSSTSLGYRTGGDLAQSTAAFNISEGAGNDNDQSSSGELLLFSPSSTTFVKHFLGRSNTIIAADGSIDNYFAGYCNTTSVVDAVQFSMDSGNIDSGVIKMYGLSKS
jgi:hypothetical protein